MINYDLLEKSLNNEAKAILRIIKRDYYNSMSKNKKSIIDTLLEEEKIVIVNRGVSIFKDKTLAHGGRTLKDGKIHFYPDVREWQSNEQILEKLKKILPHECFHYFIQPDNLKLNTKIEKEMAAFYTEGLVEKETRKFCKKHPEIATENANYGYNIKFVNMIQSLLDADSYEIIFSENDYIRNIGKYVDIYKNILKSKNEMLSTINEISKELPQYLQRKFLDMARKIVLQSENVNVLKEKLKSIEIISEKSIEKLENHDKEILEPILESDVISENEEKIIFEIIPELIPEKNFLQNNPWHIYDVWDHTKKVFQNSKADKEIRLALLLHDIGKPYSYQDDGNGIRHFKGHAQKSSEISENILNRLGYSKDDITNICFLIANHDKEIKIENINQRNLKTMKKLLYIQFCDASGYNPEYIQGVYDRLNELNSYLNLYEENNVDKEDVSK